MGLGLITLLIWQISHQEGLADWWSELSAAWATGDKLLCLVLVCIAMPINWLLEALKWRQLVSNNWALSWRETIEAVLAGVSVSIVTPNRIGEYGGRAMVAPAKQTFNVIFSSILGSICQWVVFVGCGWPALVYWFGNERNWASADIWIVASSVPVLMLALLVSFLSSRFQSWYIQVCTRFRWWRWLRLKLGTNSLFERRQFLLALFWALLRFWVYSFQYLLLLWFFNIPLGFWEGLSGIFSIYLIQAGIPLPPGLSVITRSELAMMIWGSTTANPLAIISATFSLYFINLVIPAMFGALFIIKKESKKAELREI